MLLHFSQLHFHCGGAAKKDQFDFSTDFFLTEARWPKI